MSGIAVRVALTRPLPIEAALGAVQLRQQGAAVLSAPLLEIAPIAAVLAELSTAVPLQRLRVRARLMCRNGDGCCFCCPTLALPRWGRPAPNV